MENQTSVMNTAGKVIPPGVNVGQTKRIVLVKNDENGEAEMAIMSFRVW
jgi:hypothetical protein